MGKIKNQRAFLIVNLTVRPDQFQERGKIEGSRIVWGDAQLDQRVEHLFVVDLQLTAQKVSPVCCSASSEILFLNSPEICLFQPTSALV
jgi:hypothetical protein